MTPEIEQLYQKLNNADVFIIGGGYSFSNVNIDKLNNKNIIAVNSACKFFNNATAIYWCDDSWAGQNCNLLDSHPCNLRFTKRNYKGIRKSKGTYNATVLKHTGDCGYDPDINCVRGNNSGTQILNFVINMNPNKILLLGFDMKTVNNKTHWHKEYSTVVKNEIYDTLFIPSMNSFADELSIEQLNKIINCSSDSALNCFRKDDLNNHL